MEGKYIPQCFTLDEDSNFQTNFFLLIPGMNLYIYVVTNITVDINLKTKYADFYRFVILLRKVKMTVKLHC